MSLIDQINRVNARSRRVPSIVFRILLAWLLSAIALGVLVPALHARGIALQPWIPWTIIVASLVLCVGPVVIRRYGDRQ
jgi:hypothetical protein